MCNRRLINTWRRHSLLRQYSWRFYYLTASILWYMLKVRTDMEDLNNTGKKWSGIYEVSLLPSYILCCEDWVPQNRQFAMSRNLLTQLGGWEVLAWDPLWLLAQDPYEIKVIKILQEWTKAYNVPPPTEEVLAIDGWWGWDIICFL